MLQRKGLLPLVATGGVIGGAAVILAALGNPANMGICVACFLRDTAGALGLDGAPTVQYIRPEIIGFILGAFLLSALSRDFRPTGGSAPLVRFVLSFFVMIGALVFLGCPLRMILRLSAGDGNALVGLAGFVAGIGGGSAFLRKGFSLGRGLDQPRASGWVMPGAAIALFVLLVAAPAFVHFSKEGPGSMHAPLAAALAAGLVIGGLAQRSRLCMSGGIRDVLLIRNFTLFSGYAAVFAVALLGNLALGNFNPGFAGQPIAHTDAVWNFLGMVLVGYGSTLLGGCPLRQIIMAGGGDADAGVCVLGMLAGAATAHNFGLAASPAGVPANGQIAVAIGFAVLTVVAASCVRAGGAGRAAAA